MKIRKHANISSQLLSSAIKFSDPSLIQPRFCQLNQSPWDVITFPPSNSSPPFQGLFMQHEYFSAEFNRNNVFTGNGNESLTDSIGVVQSEASIGEQMEVEKMEIEGIQLSNGVRTAASERTNEKETIICCKFKCMRVAKEGNSLCEYHLTQMKKGKTSAPALPTENSRRTHANKSVHVNNGHEFYYYSGFGPSWGNKRCPSRKDNTDTRSKAKTSKRENEQMAQTYPTQDEILDCVEYKDDYGYDNGETIRKKPRKPIKARSLKSLMSSEK